MDKSLFDRFDLSFVDNVRQEEWFKYSIEIIKALQSSNVGLISDTGTGKTVMAFLAAAVLGKRVLFLTPMVILTKQHLSLYYTMCSHKEAVAISGKTVKKDQNWGANLIIATPHIFLSARKKGLTSESDFDLLIVDELHKAQGQYPYVEVAELFNKQNIRILSLSASPGEDLDELANLENVYQIKTWVKAEIIHPEVKNKLIVTKSSEELLQAGACLKNLYFKSLSELIDIFNLENKELLIKADLENPFLTQKECDSLVGFVNDLEGLNFYAAKKLCAKLIKIGYLYQLITNEGYASFLNYVILSLAKDTSVSAKEITNNVDFRKLFTFIKETQPKKLHPKEEALLKFLAEQKGEDNGYLIFVASKNTGNYLCQLLNNCHYKSAFLHGGNGKSIKKQDEIIKLFSQKDLKIIVATSVVEEGLSLPEIDIVINYNIPNTGVAGKQRRGRTGRFKNGLEVNIVSEDEKSKYFAIKAKEKKIETVFYPEKQKKFLKKISKKVRLEMSGQLSFSF